jgi:GDPmannose 4,6-dehydratase
MEFPYDFVIATGEMHSVREFCSLAFKYAGIDIAWRGKGIEEKGIDEKTGKVLIEIDPGYFRQAEVEQLLGDSKKAKQELGWNPKKNNFDDLVKEMIKEDILYTEKEQYIRHAFE